MGGVPSSLRLDQLDSSALVLVCVAVLAAATVILWKVGLIGWAVRLFGVLVRAAIHIGFVLWKKLFAWADWPRFLAGVVGLLALGLAGGSKLPWLAVLSGAALLFMGVTACLAYMFIDLERYEVGRGYKAVHNPLKGQELAVNLMAYGPRVGVPLLIAASVAAVAGFALLNQGLYHTVGAEWYSWARERSRIGRPRTWISSPTPSTTSSASWTC